MALITGMNHMNQCKEQAALSAPVIDRLSEWCVQMLEDAGASTKDTLRIRLSLEEILGVWLEKAGEAEVRWQMGKRFGRTQLMVAVEGRPMDPGEDEQTFLLSNRLLAQAGLALVYAYQNGENRLTLSLPGKPRTGQMTRLVLAILAAGALGAFGRQTPEEAQAIALAVTEPLFTMILGILRAISSPMIFLAVCFGVVSIGDLATVGKIGRKIITRMIVGSFAIGAVMALAGGLIFGVETGGTGISAGGLSDIYEMVLNIAPSDIVSPFLNGNALQVIFLGICVGGALLVLGDRVSVVKSVVAQADEVVQFLMGVIGKLVPLFVFLSIFNLLLSDLGGDMWGIVKVLCIAIPGCAVLMLFYLLCLSLRFHISPLLLIRKMLPTFMIALTTASSAAAFSSNLETCEKQLGIPRQVADFAIPLGQVIYMPGFVVSLFAVALCMAEYYGVAITPLWLVIAVLTVGLLAMALPPIPGGAISVFTVMFVQLGIPGEAVAVAVALNSILDFIATATNMVCLQADVTLATGRLGLLDTEKLARDR